MKAFFSARSILKSSSNCLLIAAKVMVVRSALCRTSTILCTICSSVITTILLPAGASFPSFVWFCLLLLRRVLLLRRLEREALPTSGQKKELGFLRRISTSPVAAGIRVSAQGKHTQKKRRPKPKHKSKRGERNDLG